jgi:hypothetical protein
MEESVASEARSALVGDDFVDTVCLVVAAITAVAVGVNEKNPVRVLAAICFTVFVPGRAIVSNWLHVGERSTTALSVLLSLTVLTLAATVTLWCGFWRPLGLLEVECAVSVAALGAAIVRRRRSRLSENSVKGPSPSSE